MFRGRMGIIGILLGGLILVGILHPDTSLGKPPAATAEVATFAPDRVVVTCCDNVRFRSAASLSSSVLDALPAGSTLTIVSGPTTTQGYAWYRVRQPGGAEGYVAGKFLLLATPTPTPTSTFTPTATRTSTATATATNVGGVKFLVGDSIRVTAGTNLRASAGTSASILRVLAIGATGSVLAGPTSANGYVWYRLQIGDTSGWAIQNNLVETTPPTATPTPTPAITPTHTPTSTPATDYTATAVASATAAWATTIANFQASATAFGATYVAGITATAANATGTAIAQETQTAYLATFAANATATTYAIEQATQVAYDATQTAIAGP